MVNLGLNNQPTFFGCNSTNVTQSRAGSHVPLVVYIPNAPYSYQSNISTGQLTTSDDQRDAIILNGYNVATMGNATVDRDWPTCVGCAMLQRSLERTGTAMPSICNTCFERYCWNGTLNATTPNSYEPEFKLDGVSTTSGSPRIGASSTAALGLAAMTTMFLTW